MHASRRHYKYLITTNFCVLDELSYLICHFTSHGYQQQQQKNEILCFFFLNILWKREEKTNVSFRMKS